MCIYMYVTSPFPAVYPYKMHNPSGDDARCDACSVVLTRYVFVSQSEQKKLNYLLEAFV